MTSQKNPTRNQFEPGQQSRVTRVGEILRKTKLDEFPELINVLKGDMSLVGPRPEVSKYVQCYPDAFKAILQVRPGLSDYASITYRNEEELLASQTDPERYYRKIILPDKLRLAAQYTENISFTTDLSLMIRTVMRIVGLMS